METELLDIIEKDQEAPWENNLTRRVKVIPLFSAVIFSLNLLFCTSLYIFHHLLRYIFILVHMRLHEYVYL